LHADEGPTVASNTSSKAKAWPLFDAIAHRAALKTVNPWSDSNGYEPDYATLQTLLAVPLHLNASTRSGVPALALDVWVAYELRRAGLDPDAVWPRGEPPRVVDRDVLKFVSAVPKKDRDLLLKRLRKGTATGGVATARQHPGQELPEAGRRHYDFLAERPRT
jgi:hypothetical protein